MGVSFCRTCALHMSCKMKEKLYRRRRRCVCQDLARSRGRWEANILPQRVLDSHYHDRRKGNAD
jgi:hypothetical protein